MKYAVFFPLILIALVGCGKPAAKGKETVQAVPAAPAPVATPTPVPGSSLKWSSSRIDQETTECAERGDESYTTNQWSVFCRCTYTAAAGQWTFDDFQNNFEDRYNSLYDDGTIEACLTKAGIL